MTTLFVLSNVRYTDSEGGKSSRFVLRSSLQFDHPVGMPFNGMRGLETFGEISKKKTPIPIQFVMQNMHKIHYL